MSDGHLDPDQIPDAMHGQSVLSPADHAHLVDCVTCRLEWNLVKRTALLGAEPLLRIDAGRVAGAVQARLADSPPPARRAWRWSMALATAALLLLALWYSRRGSVDLSQPAAAQQLASVLQELDSLDVSQLELVLAAIPAEASHVEQVPLSTLNTADLERVLRSMEE